MKKSKLIDVLIDIHSGGTPSTEEKDYWNGNYKWLSSGETSQRFIFDTINKITELGIKESSTKLAKKNTIVMACAGQGKTRGQVSYLLDDMYVNQSIIVMEADDTVLLPLYLFYNLSNRYDELRGGSDSSSIRGSITTTSLKSLYISYPDLNTQSKIVNVLSKYDELIEVNNKRIKILEQMAEELYKEWFVRFRFPGYEATDYKVTSPSGWVVDDKLEYRIPYDWDFGSLDNIAVFKRGKNLTTSEAIEGNIPVVSAGLEPSCYHNVANVKGYSLTVSGSGANAGALLYHLEDIWASDCSYYQNDNNIWFVYCTLKFLQKVISNMQVGAAQPHVYPRTLSKLSVVIPKEKYINQFNNKAMTIFDDIKTINDQNKILIKQRDLLLPRLMSGNLEVK